MKTSITQARAAWREDQARAARLAAGMSLPLPDWEALQDKVTEAMDDYGRAVSRWTRSDPAKLSELVAAGDQLQVLVNLLVEVIGDDMGPHFSALTAKTISDWDEAAHPDVAVAGEEGSGS